MSLLIELDALRADAGTTYLDQITAAAAELSRSGMVERCAGVGDVAPDFALAAPDGRLVGLSDLLLAGPVVISFFRGEWCRYCRAELQALLAVQPALARLGASLLLISPEPPSETLVAAAQVPRVHVLQDPMLGVALRYGLVYLVPPLLRRHYRATGFDMERELSSGSWLLPLPADYIVDRTGRVVLAYVDPDFTRRLDPDLLVETLAETGA